MCPNCDHTMQSLWTNPEDKSMFWCPRCGTLKVQWPHAWGRPHHEEIEAPKLLQYVRSFTSNYLPVPNTTVAYAYAAMKEASLKPEER
jgi:hypothetical protein